MAEMFISAIVHVQKDAIFGSDRAAWGGLESKCEKDRKGKKMAQPMVTRYGAAPTAWFDLLGSASAAMQQIEASRAYHRTVRELSALSNRDLADLGLHRSEIRRVAYDTVYGARR